jgi:hypothetical protein
VTAPVALDRGRVLPLGEDADAFFDADWIPCSGSGEVGALVVRRGVLSTSWTDEAVAIGEVAPEDCAALAIAATATDAVAEVRGIDGPVEVTGTGAVARLVRQRLGERSSSGDSRPAAVVDCTGDRESILSAIERLDDLGTLVLVGPPLGDPVAIDLYPDVHVRGLRLVGVAPPLGDAVRPQAVPELLRGSLAEVEADGRLPKDAGWYRLPARKGAAGP